MSVFAVKNVIASGKNYINMKKETVTYVVSAHALPSIQGLLLSALIPMCWKLHITSTDRSTLKMHSNHPCISKLVSFLFHISSGIIFKLSDKCIIIYITLGYSGPCITRPPCIKTTFLETLYITIIEIIPAFM